MVDLRHRRAGFARAVLAAGALGGAALACSAVEQNRESVAEVRQSTSVNSVPCDAWSHAVIANTGAVILNSQATVDSYSSARGAYGGANVGSAAIVEAGTVFTNNGGTLRGRAIPHAPAGLGVVPVPTGATKLPLGATTPGSLNINSGQTLTLAPGNYVVQNLTVSFNGKVNISPPGVVRVWVTGTLNLGGNENLNGAPSNLAFFVNSSGFVNVNSNGRLFGLIYAPSSTVNVNSPVFGSVVGKSVTLNSGAAVHMDGSAACSSTGGGTPPPVASHPPRPLPQPPKQQGCYVGTANGWAATPCSPSNSFPLETSQNAITTPKGTSATVPFQFAQFETTFTQFGSVNDSMAGVDQFSIQGNTVPFTGNNGDTDWVQFGVLGSGDDTLVFMQTWDVTTWNSVLACPMGCDISCGCTTYGMGSNPLDIPNRTGGYKQFDFATVAGSVYSDTGGNPVIGMVAQFSWFDSNDDPQNFRGLYSVVAPDVYGLAGRWTDFSGAALGFSGGSTANFTNSSLLYRTVAGSCIGGTSPVNGIPWPATCSGSPDLLPSTTIRTVSPTGENNNLCQVGTNTPLVAASSNLVYTEELWSTSCSPAPACISTANRIFVKSTDEDTGARPINVGTQPFWESPDLFIVPQGTPVSVDAISTETLVTAGNTYDVYVRVNNDFGCSAVTGAKALAYIADPAALSVAWLPITGGAYVGGPGGAGVSVPAGQRALIGPLTFVAPTSGFGDGHRCLLAAIQADGEPGPANTTDPLASFQVGQRNIQFDDCKLPLTNATTSNGTVTVTLTAVGVTPTLGGSQVLSVTFDDPALALFNAWTPGAGTTYAVTQAGGKTTVVLGQTSVVLAPAPIAAGQSITASASITLGTGDPQSTLQIQATLEDMSGTALVNNGLSCVVSPPIEPG